MRASTEEFLYFLLWNADTLMNPTWRNLNDGFEAWAWRHDLGRRIAELEKLKLLESNPGLDCRRIVRLTESGRRMALGGRDPLESWRRSWDGRWRMIVFDIPVFKGALRAHMWRYLRSHAFGYLQDSVWITPDSLDAVRAVISSDAPNAEALMLFEGSPCGGETNECVVKGAWNFEEVNRCYHRVIAHLIQPHI
jgi:phenylacetic acid degradation operon negative regulatory protein